MWQAIYKGGPFADSNINQQTRPAKNDAEGVLDAVVRKEVLPNEDNNAGRGVAGSADREKREM